VNVLIYLVPMALGLGAAAVVVAIALLAVIVLGGGSPGATLGPSANASPGASALATLLPTGAVAALLNGQTIALLPVSLFGMSVSAAELPAMSGALGVDPGYALARRNLRGLKAGSDPVP